MKGGGDDSCLHMSSMNSVKYPTTPIWKSSRETMTGSRPEGAV